MVSLGSREWGQEKAFRFDFTPAKVTVYPNVPSDIIERGQTADVLFTIGTDVWLGGHDGAVRFDGEIWTKHSADDGLIDGAVTTILKDRDDNLWMAGRHQGKSAAARYNGSSWRIFTEADGLVGDAIYTGCVTDTGDIWFGTRGATWDSSPGILRFDGQEWRVYTTADGLMDYVIYAIAQTPDQAVWFGTMNGLSRFDGEDWTSYTTGQGGGNSPEKIRTLFLARDSSLWVGYSSRAKGVTRYDGKKWIRYTTDDGLDSDNVWQIYQSQDGSFWFGMVRGLSRFDGETWSTYSPADSPIPSGRIRSIGETPDGVLWLREDGGDVAEVVRFERDQNAPETFLESASDQVSSAGNLLIGWFGRDLWDETAPRDMYYQWRLNGGAWTPIWGQTRHTLTSLPDGRHVFEVRAVDRDGNADSTPAVHAFIVEAPWWKNSWVIGGTVLLVGHVVIQTGRVVRRDRRLQESNRILQEKTESLEAGNRQIQEANRLKSQFLANMSHELRTPLNAILGFSQLMTRDSGLTDKQKENLEVIGRSGEHLLGLINDVLDMSKIEAGQVGLSETGFDLHRLLDTLEEMFLLRAGDKGLELNFERVLDLPQYIRADEGKIRQVLINLLGNAIKFYVPEPDA